MNPQTQQPIAQVSTTISSWTEVVDYDLFDMEAFATGRVMDIDVILGASNGEGTTFLMGLVHEHLPNWFEMDQMYYGVVQMVSGADFQNYLPQYPYPCVEGNPM